MVNTRCRTYVSPKTSQHEEGRGELQAQVEAALQVLRLAEQLGPRPRKPRVRVHLH